MSPFSPRRSRTRSATRSSSRCSPPVALGLWRRRRGRRAGHQQFRGEHLVAVAATPTSGRARRRRLGRHADPDHVRRHGAHRAAARQRHGARSRRAAAADAHLPRPQQRGEDRAASPRALGRRSARRARSGRRRHRLLGPWWRLRPLLQQRRPVLRTASCASARSTATCDAIKRLPEDCARHDRTRRGSSGMQKRMARIFITGSADGLGRAAAADPARRRSRGRSSTPAAPSGWPPSNAHRPGRVSRRRRPGRPRIRRGRWPIRSTGWGRSTR